jgi:hypothetical protein
MNNKVKEYIVFTKHNDMANWLMACITRDLAWVDIVSLVHNKYPHLAVCEVDSPDTADLTKKLQAIGLTKNGYALKLPGRVVKER